METQERAHSNERAIANIGAEMGRSRITQKRLAQMLGMSQAAVSDRQRGHTPWSLDELDQVAELFGVTVTDLLREAKVLPFPRSLNAEDGNITCHDVAACHTTQAVAA